MLVGKGVKEGPKKFGRKEFTPSVVWALATVRHSTLSATGGEADDLLVADVTKDAQRRKKEMITD